MKKNHTTYISLKRTFSDIGVCSGDNLVVHSSLRSLGRISGGADVVVDALLSVIGRSGNLVVPTFNYSRPAPEPYFDINRTPSRCGVLTEVVRLRAESIRSMHPTHSVSVIGPDAAEITVDHFKHRAFGIGSPIDRLAHNFNGKILLLGVNHTSNSTIHLAEEYVGLPKDKCNVDGPKVKVFMPDKSVSEFTVDSSASCSLGFGSIEFLLRKKSAIRDAKFFNCYMQLMNSRLLIEIAVDFLKVCPTGLFCNSLFCPTCTPLKEIVKSNKLSYRG